jgi:phage terminase large subunit
MPASTPPTCDRPPPAARPYQPRGAARALLLSRAPEVLAAGPAGTGKSRACLEKVHLCAAK